MTHPMDDTYDEDEDEPHPFDDDLDDEEGEFWCLLDGDCLNHDPLHPQTECFTSHDVETWHAEMPKTEAN